VPAPSPSCSHCGKQRTSLKRCSRCKQDSYCGAKCQNADWKKHREHSAPPLSLEAISLKMKEAVAPGTGDWRELLSWEGRVDELLDGQKDSIKEMFLGGFVMAHTAGMAATNRSEHPLAIVRLESRRVDLLGKMEWFRDQGAALCHAAKNLLHLESPQEATLCFNRARDVGEKHGLFSLE